MIYLTYRVSQEELKRDLLSHRAHYIFHVTALKVFGSPGMVMIPWRELLSLSSSAIFLGAPVDI